MLPRTIAVAAVFALVVGTLVVAALVACLGAKRLRSETGNAERVGTRLRAVAPYAAILAAVLAINKGFQESIWALSEAVGYEATGLFYRIEGDLVAGVQAAIPDVLATYFAFVYMFGYGLALVCPLFLYLFAASPRPLKALLVAYTVNYTAAIVAYTLVIAHGPRRAVGDVQGVLQEAFPYFTLLTGQVNQPTNVFPSLHTSMSVTVLLFAVLTREQFPRWAPIAAVLTGSIVLSTIYLGVHWLIDVVAGVGLAVAAVGLSLRLIGRNEPTRTSESARIAPERTRD